MWCAGNRSARFSMGEDDSRAYTVRLAKGKKKGKKKEVCQNGKTLRKTLKTAAEEPEPPITKHLENRL